MKKEEREEARKDQAERLHAAWDQQGDWWAKCRKCGQRLVGTPAALRAHVCPEVKDGTSR